MNKFAGLTSRKTTDSEPEAKEAITPQPVQSQVIRMLGGRVPDPIFREFTT